MRGIAVGVVLVAACAFDGSGDTLGGGQDADVGSGGTAGSSSGGGVTPTSGGEAGSSGGGSHSGTTEAADPTTSGGPGGDPTSGGPTSLSDPSTSGGETSPGDGTTTMVDPSTTMVDPSTTTGPPNNDCLGPMAPIVVLVENSDVEWAMVKEMSGLGEGIIATSTLAELGYVDFEVNIPCDDDYQVWGRVVDQYPGAQNYDPDSFYAEVDGGGERAWIYGCQTDGDQDKWQWKRVRRHDLPNCSGGPTDWTVALTAGVHTFRFRARESENNQSARAGIARLIVANDPNFVPTDQ